ncbi:hypothetical protein [Carboxylicivirga sp. RSCT41]|uniref:hypothetical protein n=1 Tax=Carboxylicivirga agarovorans TaxID=3417570 RepID=UPI003D3423FE
MKIGIKKSMLLVVVVVLAFLSGSTSAQTKREVQFTLDTLYKSHLRLVVEYGQLIEEWKKYDAFYRHVKLSMLDKDLVNEPIEAGVSLFDSVWNKNTERYKLLEDSTIYLLDSLSRLQGYQQDLIVQNDLYVRMLNGKLTEASYPNTPNELLGLWNLYLSPMQLKGEGTKSGLVSHNPFTIADSLQRYNIYQLEFMADELANIYFKDGTKQNCFYEVKDFSVGEPYAISCTKQKDGFEMTIHVSPMPAGLEVSYEIPVDSTQVIYFNGLMKH